MHNFRHQRKFILAASVLAGGILIAAGVLALANFNNSGPIAIIQSPQWTRDAGAGIAVPACNASLASITCSGGYPVVQIAIDSCDQHGGAELQFYSPGLPAGYYNAGSFACGSIAEWSAARPGYVGPPQSNTTYTWDTAAPNAHGSPFSTGSFTTPNCVISPLSASCSVSPSSASTGQTVTWSASASGGQTGEAVYQWSGVGTAWWLNAAGDSTVSARRFQPASLSSLTKVSLYLAKSGGTSGSVWVTIETDSGGYPSGTAVAGGTSNSVNVSAVPVWTDRGWIDFTFPGATLDYYGLYWIVLRGSFSGVPNDGVGNYALIHFGSGNDTSLGSRSLTRDYQNTSVWTNWTGSRDLSYKAYTYPPVYSYSWSGTDGLSGTTQSVQKSYSSSGTKTGSVTVTSGSQQVPPQSCSNSVNVSEPPLSASCSVSPTSASTGQTVTWSASASGGTGSYTYSWSGTDGLSGTTQSVQKSYSTAGTKTGSVTVTSGSQTVPQPCGNSVSINTPPCVGSCTNGPPPCPRGGGISCPPGSNQNPGTAAFGENPPGACVAPRQPAFAWTYSDPDGDPQSAYELEVDNNSGFSSPEIDTGKTSGAVTSYLAPPGVLSYDTTYYWRVRVWDSKNAVSNWSNGPTFSTQPHEAPSANYTWSPTEPNVNQKTKFTDQSTVYGGSSKQSWAWTFSDGNPSSSAQQNPDTKFQSGGDKATTLILKDSDNLSCGAQKTVTVGGLPSSPSWEEVTPE